jgi:putative copper export protein
LGIFALTGVYLTLVDPKYLGLGNFNNLWAILMLVKHLLLLVMIGLGFWHNAILRVGPLMSSNQPEQAIARFRTHVNVMAVCGALVLLLTAIAQAE